MGPRAENRGYVSSLTAPALTDAKLQWVHGQRTVVTPGETSTCHLYLSTSMGPRAENRGYGEAAERLHGKAARLQWVHGQRTVVTDAGEYNTPFRKQLQWVHGQRTVVTHAYHRRLATRDPTSMGPRAENGGYVLDESSI